MKRIKRPKPQPGARLKAEENDVPPDTTHWPSFSFKYCAARHYGIEDCQDSDKVALVRRMAKLSTMPWNQILSAARHSLGCEKISQKSIRPLLPDHLTPDRTIYSMRFSGMKPMVGYRDDGVFFILFLDHDLDVYDHGR